MLIVSPLLLGLAAALLVAAYWMQPARPGMGRTLAGSGLAVALAGALINCTLIALPELLLILGLAGLVGHLFGKRLVGAHLTTATLTASGAGAGLAALAIYIERVVEQFWPGSPEQVLAGTVALAAGGVCIGLCFGPPLGQMPRLRKWARVVGITLVVAMGGSLVVEGGLYSSMLLVLPGGMLLGWGLATGDRQARGQTLEGAAAVALAALGWLLQEPVLLAIGGVAAGHAGMMLYRQVG